MTLKEQNRLLQEIMDKDATAKDWIDDFVASDDPKFKGKSKNKRREMAIAAYSSRQHNESVEELNEALKSKKAYDDMTINVGHIKDDTYHSIASTILHNAPEHDHQQNDYARHSVLFDNRLTNQHLNAISDHVAAQGKVTNELDKNFHKNVNSVSTLRAALRNNSPDSINDAKKALTTDHKHAIMSHGTDAEKSFVLQHGLANKSQISHAIENGSAGAKESAINHLRFLKDSGSDKHADLIAKHVPDDSTVSHNKQSFASKIKDRFSAALGNLHKSAQDIANKRVAAKTTSRIEPKFESKAEMKLEALDELFTTIADGDLASAQDKLKDALAAKVAETMDSMKETIAKSMFVQKEEALDEISKKTLGSYIKKSAADATANASKAAYKLAGNPHNVYDNDRDLDKDDEGEEDDRKAYKRIQGIKKATDKLTKESTDDTGTNSPAKFAHFYGSKVNGYSVKITDSHQPVGGTDHACSGKSEAKKIAKAHAALPWNF